MRQFSLVNKTSHNFTTTTTLINNKTRRIRVMGKRRKTIKDVNEKTQYGQTNKQTIEQTNDEN